jgi:glycosyltransferase involved in cell wall biosynthesis
LHAFAAGVAVVGTPVEAVKEYIIDGVNGMLAASVKPREIAAGIEAFFAGGAALRGRLTEEARRRWATVSK